MNMNRPKLDKTISIKDFKYYYWLKEELIVFCREIGINSSGGKIDISNRIVKYLEIGEIVTKSELKSKKSKSKFDWNNEKWDSHTLITDNYKNSENARGFFKKMIGTNFKFNVEFMNWMKSNAGKTLGDAIEKWRTIAEQKKDKNQKTVLTRAEENKITNTFNNKVVEDDFSVVVSYDDIKAKNYSLSAGQYFKVKIEYVDNP